MRAWNIPNTQFAAKLPDLELDQAIFCKRDPLLLPLSEAYYLRDYARVRLLAAAQANADVLQHMGHPTLQDLMHCLGTKDDDSQWYHAVAAGQRFWIYRAGRFVYAVLELRPLHVRVLAHFFHAHMSCVDVLLGESDMAGDVDLLTPETHVVMSKCVAQSVGSILETPTAIHGGQIRRWFSLRRVWVIACVLK